jgi:type IV secretory pathway VirB2 component (pilin)
MKFLSAGLIAMFAAILPSTLLAQTVAGEPQGSGPILAAVNWIEGTLLGNLATSVAVIAVAITGFMMLTGRVNWRHGITVIIGCFIIFGAAAIVAGIQSAARVAG